MATNVRMVMPLLLSARPAVENVQRGVSYLLQSGWRLVHDSRWITQRTHDAFGFRQVERS
jgi:hypothetical protein